MMSKTLSDDGYPVVKKPDRSGPGYESGRGPDINLYRIEGHNGTPLCPACARKLRNDGLTVEVLEEIHERAECAQCTQAYQQKSLL